MDKRIVVLPLALLAGTTLSGCVAAAIPALAGSAMFGTRVLDRDGKVASAVAAAPTPAPVIKAVQVPTLPVMTADTVTPALAPVAVAIIPKAPLPDPAPAWVMPPVSAADPDPAWPLTSGQLSFARFVRYAQTSAIGAKSGADLPSAILSDPIALDGKRRRCAADEQQIALIDLDPAGGIFAPSTTPTKQPGLALGLAVLREAGVEIAWLSDLSVIESGAVRTMLEQAGLDPRGEDIISLRRNEADTKQQRRDNLAGITCIIAIAGDERADFDDRYKYLRSSESGEDLEPIIGNGWFLIEQLPGN